MIPLEIEIKKFLLVTVALTVIFSVGVLLFDPTPMGLLFKIGVFGAVITVFWFLYEKMLWKLPFFRLMGWLCSTPDLNGRWEGTVGRHGENSPHRFVLEVIQTMTKLQCYTYSENSSGESLIVKIAKDGVDNKYKLISYWSCKTKSKKTIGEFDKFNGLSVMEINISDSQKSIKDYYFTDRYPPTRGDVELTWVSNKLDGKFK